MDYVDGLSAHDQWTLWATSWRAETTAADIVGKECTVEVSTIGDRRKQQVYEREVRGSSQLVSIWASFCLGETSGTTCATGQEDTLRSRYMMSCLLLSNTGQQGSQRKCQQYRRQ